MRKLTTIATALVLALAVGTSATVNQPARFDVRPFTMGGEKINNILKSQSNIWLYPQTINMYADQAEAVFDASSANELARLGINFQFGTNNPFVLGIYVNNTNGAAFNPYANFTWANTFPLQGVVMGDNNVYDLFWGKVMGGGNPFGLHLQIYNSSNEVTGVAGSKNSLSVFAADAGLTNGPWDLAGSVVFTTFTEEDALGPVRDPNGNLALEFRVRKWDVIPDWVGHATLGFAKTAFKTTGAGDEKWNTLNAEVGLGLNYTPTSSVNAVLDIGFQYLKADFEEVDVNGLVITDKSEKESSIPPYYALGVDAEVLSWLDVRLGASNIRRVQTSTATLPLPVAPDVDASFNDVNTFVGVGLHWGNLTLDAQLDPEFVVSGPDFVSGDQTNDMFVMLAATYNFGN